MLSFDLPATQTDAGVVAKWQGRSLQNSDRRFESARRLRTTSQLRHARLRRASLRPALAALILIAALAACSGPERRSADNATATLIPATATAVIAAPSAPAATATASPAPTQAPAPTATLPPPAATATSSPTAPPTATATATPTPEPRPADQSIDIPDVDAHYALDIRAFDLDSGHIDAGEVITIDAFSSPPPEQIFLQVVPAHEGFFTLVDARLQDAPIAPDVLNDGFTLAFPLPPNAQAPLEIALDFTLDVGTVPGGWGVTAIDGDAFRLGNWFPIISDDHPWSDTLDPSYTRVATFDVSLALDSDVVFAHTGEIVDRETLSDGRLRYVMHAEHARDFALCLSRAYEVDTATAATGTRIELYTLPDSDAGLESDEALARRQRILGWAADAIERLGALVGPYPYPTFRLADAGPHMPGGVEFPNMIYINPNYPELDRLIYHETAHQWMYGIIGNRTLLDGWIDEGGAEFFERGLPTDFTEIPDVPAGGYVYPLDAAWDEMAAQPRDDWYYSIYEQGARFYDDVLAKMGADAFWAALQEIYQRFAFDIVTPWDLLGAWQRHSATDLRPLFAEYFRYAWIDQLPEPGD